MGDETDQDIKIAENKALIAKLRGKTDAESLRIIKAAEANIEQYKRDKIKANHDAGFAAAESDYAGLTAEELAKLIPDLKKLLDNVTYTAEQKAVIQGAIDYCESKQPAAYNKP